MDRQMLRAALVARYGPPRAVPIPDAVDDEGTAVIRVYGVGSLEAGQAFAALERAEWDNPCRVELRESVGWCVVVDLRDRVADMKAAARGGQPSW